jgi:hypothetical protein
MTEVIDLKRYGAMERVIESLHGLRENYLDLGYECPQGTTHSFNCGSSLYGVRTLGLIIRTLSFSISRSSATQFHPWCSVTCITAS